MATLKKELLIKYKIEKDKSFIIMNSNIQIIRASAMIIVMSKLWLLDQIYLKVHTEKKVISLIGSYKEIYLQM